MQFCRRAFCGDAFYDNWPSSLPRVSSLSLSLSLSFLSTPPSSLMPLFTEFFDNDDLVHMMLGVADPYTVYRLRTVSRPVLEVVDRYIKSAFNIDRFLQQRFVADPVAFRSMMARTGCVIGGLTALEFFARTERRNTPLELFVEGYEASKVCSYLVDRCGYSFVPGLDQHRDLEKALDHSRWRTGIPLMDYISPVAAVLRFEGLHRGRPKRIRVSCPAPSGILARAVLSLPTSELYHCACCLFLIFAHCNCVQRRCSTSSLPATRIAHSLRPRSRTLTHGRSVSRPCHTLTSVLGKGYSAKSAITLVGLSGA